MSAPQPWVNSLGYSCHQEDYPGKNFTPGHVFQIHIPKNGGSSLEKWSWKAGYRFTHEHLMPHQRKRDPADAFRFAFARNPYTRFISQYTFCKQGPRRTWNWGFPCHLTLPPHNMSFDDWWFRLWSTILRIGNGSLPSMHSAARPGYRAGAFDPQGRPCRRESRVHGCRNTPGFWCSGIWWGNCFGPVSQWVYRNGHSGQRAVDWVGRLENITTDFACLRNLLNKGWKRAPMQLGWSRLSNADNVTARTRKKPPRDWLTNQTLVQIIRTHYRDDFDNFGYSFDVPRGKDY